MRVYSLLPFLCAVRASFPLVDFDRMGRVGLAGSFAGLDIFNSSASPVSFDPTTSSLLARASDGSLSYLASTNQGASILAGCALGTTFYLAGDFTNIGNTSASNIASYSSGSFSSLGSGGPNGQVFALYCDTKNKKVWAGGSFTSPGPAVAVWDPSAKSWSAAPFKGLTGGEGRVLSITTNSSAESLFFAGSFVATFDGGASNSTVILNGTNNPNVPYSVGATPFSSSLVPIPLSASKTQVSGIGSSGDAGFTDITQILCPAGSDGPGNSWFAADGNTALVTAETFTSISANGVRLGNTFQANHGTTQFSVESLPDNTLQTLSYRDPATGQTQTCSDPCPLSTNSSILYQDFLFSNPVNLTGVQIKLSGWTGEGPGLHILQLLSSGAFASAVDNQNSKSCFSPSASSTALTGSWKEYNITTNIAGTVETVLVAPVAVGTPSSTGPTFTWMPYVSASGDYEVNLLVPGCNNMEDCAKRTSVQVTLFPGQGLSPVTTVVDQTNVNDASPLIYKGPILPTNSSFVTTITMALADQPIGQGQDGQYEIIADRIQMILTSVNATSSSNGTGQGSSSSGSTGAGNTAFGFFEWPLNGHAIDATNTLSNTSKTTLDAIGIELFNAIGGSNGLVSSAAAITAVAHHSSGTIFLAGNFTLSSASTASSSHVVAFKNGNLSPLSDGGLNGPVTSLALVGNTLYVGGSFTDTATSSLQGKAYGVVAYNVPQDQWSAMGSGVNGDVRSLGVANGQLQVAGNFTELLGSIPHPSAGIATWNLASAMWVNSGGFLAGSMTFVCNGTTASSSDNQAQFIAGNVAAFSQYGASGFVMLQNGEGNSPPMVAPLSIQLDGSLESAVASSSNQTRRSHLRRGLSSLVQLAGLFSRQSSGQLAPLPSPPPAIAPAVLAGAFWTNTSNSHEVAIIGGNFSFASGSGESQGVAIYDPQSSTITPLQGAPVNGTVRALLVQGDTLFIGGEFSISGTSAVGFAVYDLINQKWDLDNVQALQPSSGSTVVVRSITNLVAKSNTIVAAGTFAQAGTLACVSICSFDTMAHQWNSLGNGIDGEVAAVAYAGDDILVASGSIALSDNTGANVASYSMSNSTWSAVGSSSTLPGPVTALTVNNGNFSSIFAAGRSNDGSSAYLSFWDGIAWTNLGSSLQGTTNVSQLTMVPLQDTHSANGVIESDRMLMVSGLLSDATFGNVSTALYDGQTFFPYITSTSSTGTPGSVSSLFYSFSTFSFTQHHYLAVGVVILISIAIAAGIVFLVVLIGILWTLFSRRNEQAGKYELNEGEDDDDSLRHRPSSLLEHINAATRTTILAGGAFGAEKGDEKADLAPVGGDQDQDPFGGDGYVPAPTPAEAMGGALSAGHESSRPAHARYSFDGDGEGELALKAGDELEVLDDRDPAWWYIRNPKTGAEGVAPASYMY